MAKLCAKNDWLIDDFLTNSEYEVRPDGTIWTIVQLNGKAGATWREAGKTDKEGYREIRYRGRWLKAHRIVYRKFHGELDPYFVVDHSDRNTGNNRPDNLSLITPRLNNVYRFRRQKADSRKNELPAA